MSAAPPFDARPPRSSSAAAAPLPTLSRDGLPAAARRGAVAGVIAAHLVGAWGLMQIESVRNAVGEVAPMMVDLVAPPAPPTPPAPPPPPTPKPIVKTPPPAPLVSAAPSPAPAVFEAPPPPVEPTPIVIAEAPPAPPAPPAQPKTIAITQVTYLTPPVLTYPSMSKRLREAGQVHVRVLVDASGQPQQMTLIKSSGFPRLDDAAQTTVRATRFRPYTENGVAQPFWVVMPLSFEME